MNSEAEFANIYSSRLTPLLESLEVSRKQVVKLFWNAIIWLLLLIPVVYVAVSLGNPWILLLGAAPIVVAVLRFSRYGKSKRNYVLGFKQTVIKELVKLQNTDLIYMPQSKINLDEYCEADIFHERIDSYDGDDLVNGFIGVTAIRFSELHHQEKRETKDSRGNRQTTWVTIFKGIFFIADFNKNFIGRTYVFPDAGSSFLGIGKLFEKWSGGRGELVKLENPEFEKIFTVYSTDQVEARYILSPSLMERLVKFRMKKA